jgi:hypothetical protein
MFEKVSTLQNEIEASSMGVETHTSTSTSTILLVGRGRSGVQFRHAPRCNQLELTRNRKPSIITVSLLVRLVYKILFTLSPEPGNGLKRRASRSFTTSDEYRERKQYVISQSDNDTVIIDGLF